MNKTFIFRLLCLQYRYKPPLSLRFYSWQQTFWRTAEFISVRPLLPSLLPKKKPDPQRVNLLWIIGWIVTVADCSGECQHVNPACPEKPCTDSSACHPHKIHSSGQSQLCLEASDLSHGFLLKQANTLLVDAVTRIMTETISALEDYHCEYRTCMDEMMRLMELTREASDCQQEILAFEMAVIRSRLGELKKKTSELESYMDSISRLSHCAAETAFLANAEYASICLMERLNSILLQAKQIKEKSQELEKASNELHALIIIETGKSLK